jgi:hypothetical protein
MRTIYRKASSTIIWLGVGDDKTKMAFEFVSRLASISTDLKASGVAYSRIPNAWPLLERFGLQTALSKRSTTA